MRSYLTAGATGILAFCVTLHASILPTLQLDSNTLKAYSDYISEFENTISAQFYATGKLWIDGDPRKSAFDAGKFIVEPRENQDVANGSIHHFSGVVHVKGGTIAGVRRVMEDYPGYPKYFKPDVGAASGEMVSDSTPADEHFHSKLLLTQSTLWINVTYEALYDTHYKKLDRDRWTSRSAAIGIRELLDPKNASGGAYPEGNDHGFLWKTNTYWFAREQNGGIDLEADSIALSRPNVTGFAWWGTKRSHDAVEKMLRDVKAAIEVR